MIYARLAVVRKWFFGGAKEVFSNYALLSPELLNEKSSNQLHFMPTALMQLCSTLAFEWHLSIESYPFCKAYRTYHHLRHGETKCEKSSAAPRLALHRKSHSPYELPFSMFRMSPYVARSRIWALQVSFSYMSKKLWKYLPCAEAPQIYPARSLMRPNVFVV